MAKLLSKCSLEELYERPKKTAKVAEYIRDKDVFTSINQRYCDQVCTFPVEYKDPKSHLNLAIDPRADILLLSRHPSPPDRYKDSKRLEMIFTKILRFVLTDKFRYTKWNHQYLAKCAPNEKQTVTKCKGCFPYLKEQIRAMKPKVIVAMHTEVTKALGLKEWSNAKQRGSVGFYELDGERIPVILTVHPEATLMIRQNASGAMWGPDYFGVLHRDLLKAVGIATDSIKLKTFEQAMQEIRDNNQIIVTRSLEEVKEECDKILALGPGKVLSWDTETTSLDPWSSDARFLMHQFGYRRDDGLIQAVVVPLWHKCNKGYKADDAWEHVEKILVDPSIKKVAHNAKFDLLFTIVTKGVRPLNVSLDTMLLLHSLNSGVAGNYGLKVAVWDYLLESGLGGYESYMDIEYQEKMAAIEAEKVALEKEAKKASRGK